MSGFLERGREHGAAAGSWLIDGNTSSETARAILQGIADGDPEVMDMQPSPLSGEWAGESIGELIDGYDELNAVEQDEACAAYEQGFGEGFWAEVERAARVAS